MYDFAVWYIKQEEGECRWIKASLYIFAETKLGNIHLCALSDALQFVFFTPASVDAVENA